MNRDIALHDGLTAQTRIQLKIGSLLDPVELIVIHLREVVYSLFHHNMAGSAGATAATCVFQVKAEIHGDIEQRFGLAVTLIRQLA